MTLRQIVTLPDPILRRKAKPVTRFDAELQTLIDDMIETMREAPGVGLAAPQVGIPERVIVVEYAEDEEEEVAPQKCMSWSTQRSRLPPRRPKGHRRLLVCSGLAG